MRASRSVISPLRGARRSPCRGRCAPAGISRHFDVAPEAGRRDAPQLADHRLLVVVLQVQPQHAVRAVIEELVVRDVVVLPQDPGDFDLQLRHRHVHAPVPRRAGVADARQHIGDGISHTHSFVPLTSWPCARPGFLPSAPAHGSRYGRGRTSAEPRGTGRSAGSGRTVRTLNFGFRLLFSIHGVFAMSSLS